MSVIYKMTLKDYQVINREAWQRFAKEYKKPAKKAWCVRKENQI